MTQTQLVDNFAITENQLAKHAVNVHKFGGSSLANTQCIDRVVDIIRSNCQIDDVVVVSASGGTTDELFAIYQLACQQDESLNDAISALAQKQTALIESLLHQEHAARLVDMLNQDIRQLSDWLSINPQAHHSDFLAFGEVWSARLLSAVLNERLCPIYYLDARDFLIVDNCQDCNVDYSKSAAQLRAQQQKSKLVVVTGYITKDATGNSCTLGRNGSDYSATIMAVLAKANNVTLWTDVDGIYSADPRVVPSARKLHRLPNGVAKELGRLGNPVLHVNTLKPLKSQHEDKVIHLHVASSFAPDVSGTEIGKFGQIAKQELSVTFQNDLMLAQSTSFVGEQGEQAIQEFNAICADNEQGFIVVNQSQQKAVAQWLASHDTEVSFMPVSIIATVGHKVTKQGDVKARFKRALQPTKVLKLVDALNSHSVIAVLPEPCTTELLNNVHHEMTKDAKHIGLVVAGLGNIGQRFLELLPAQLNRIASLENVHLVGLLSSAKALINTDGIDVNSALATFSSQAATYDKAQLLTWLTNHPYDELVGC